MMHAFVKHSRQTVMVFAVLALVGCAQPATGMQPLPVEAAPAPAATPTMAPAVTVCRRTTVDGPYVIRATIRPPYRRILTCGRLLAIVNAYLSSPASAGGGPAQIGVWRCVVNPPGLCTSTQGRITFAHA